MWQWRWKLQSDASCRPRDAKDAGKYQKLGEKHGRDAPQNLWGRNQLCRHLDFRLLASRPVKEKISVSLSHQVCGSVLQKLQDTNTQALHNAWSGLQWVSEECHTDGQRAAGEKSIARGVNHPQDTDPQLLRGMETRAHLATLLCMDCNCKPFHSCLQVRWEFKKIIWPLSLSHTPPPSV